MRGGARENNKSFPSPLSPVSSRLMHNSEDAGESRRQPAGPSPRPPVSLHNVVVNGLLLSTMNDDDRHDLYSTVKGVKELPEDLQHLAFLRQVAPLALFMPAKGDSTLFNVTVVAGRVIPGPGSQYDRGSVDPLDLDQPPDYTYLQQKSLKITPLTSSPPPGTVNRKVEGINIIIY